MGKPIAVEKKEIYTDEDIEQIYSQVYISSMCLCLCNSIAMVLWNFIKSIAPNTRKRRNRSISSIAFVFSFMQG